MRNIFKIISVLFLIGITAFIWHNSTEIATVSAEKSMSIVNKLNELFFNGSQVVSNHFIRKLAHFTEYFLEGASIALCIVSFFEKVKKHYWGIGLVLGAVIASTDEVIQLFFDGRAGKFTDVCIDSCGVLLGLLLSYLIYSYFFTRSACK